LKAIATEINGNNFHAILMLDNNKMGMAQSIDINVYTLAYEILYFSAIIHSRLMDDILCYLSTIVLVLEFFVFIGVFAICSIDTRISDIFKYIIIQKSFKSKLLF